MDTALFWQMQRSLVDQSITVKHCSGCNRRSALLMDDLKSLFELLSRQIFQGKYWFRQEIDLYFVYYLHCTLHFLCCACEKLLNVDAMIPEPRQRGRERR